MHSQKIVHRDLNPRNILIYESGICKISDFGEACRLVDGEARGLRGTLTYMAPEVLRQCDESLGNVSGDKPYGLACDIWSVGCIVIGKKLNHILNIKLTIDYSQSVFKARFPLKLGQTTD